jgi:6-pyruvoyltetrahydropterin/6-carboxytetrahydropterin synthase
MTKGAPPRLTLSRRFAFSASHREARADWSDARNLEVFGDESRGARGHGHNYTAYLVFDGPVDPVTGVMVNLAEVKRRVAGVIDGRYDHTFLNLDTPPFDTVVPTPENVAARILAEVAALYAAERARPVACHLEQCETAAATAWSGGAVERHAWLEFSAARVTRSPHLSEAENRALFGAAAAPSGHGHNYRLRVTLRRRPDAETGLVVAETELAAVLAELRAELDHKNLSTDVAFLAALPTTTEVLALEIYRRLAARLPVARVRLFELPDFFAEIDGDSVRLGVRDGFFAAHRLHSRRLSAQENRALYGKCNNPSGHGHAYRVEATLQGALDVRTGMLASLREVREAVGRALDGFRYRHLDDEVDAFSDRPSSGENIVTALWSSLSGGVPGRLVRLRLWETENHRFTVRAAGAAL